MFLLHFWLRNGLDLFYGLQSLHAHGFTGRQTTERTVSDINHSVIAFSVSDGLIQRLSGRKITKENQQDVPTEKQETINNCTRISDNFQFS